MSKLKTFETEEGKEAYRRLEGAFGEYGWYDLKLYEDGILDFRANNEMDSDFPFSHHFYCGTEGDYADMERQDESVWIEKMDELSSRSSEKWHDLCKYVDEWHWEPDV